MKITRISLNEDINIEDITYQIEEPIKGNIFISISGEYVKATKLSYTSTLLDIGYIKCYYDDNSSVITLTKLEPTVAQIQSLAHYISIVKSNKTSDMLIVTPSQNKLYELSDYSIRDILNSIKNYYLTDKLLE